MQRSEQKSQTFIKVYLLNHTQVAPSDVAYGRENKMQFFLVLRLMGTTDRHISSQGALLQWCPPSGGS